MSAEQLEQARADLVSLDTDTPTLEQNVTTQTAELDRLRREARAGRADFDQVVAQQTRRDAAAGMLQQHLEDVAAQRGLVEELEGAAAESAAVEELRAAWAAVNKSAQEWGRVSEALEGRLRVELDRLRELAVKHREAQATAYQIMRAAAAQGSGLDLQTVGDRLGQRPTGPMDGATRDAQTQAITRALESFAELAAPDNGGELLALARLMAHRAAPRLLPEGLPLLARAWETHSAR
ncbi:hypothetical protein [Deinococcus marmoris]|uniref:Uncharacterized protein n=1 Tax=Deinococcus marmoris TaxID=249408 RepID=A0A1U7NX53_9DEIO|nr:hypothetical protein [Deinococcus marmoris]OLV17484.1 hypothetical protein BOO71_0008665 [Deinococcus marmoris]